MNGEIVRNVGDLRMLKKWMWTLLVVIVTIE
jgi:hypothetical protein